MKTVHEQTKEGSCCDKARMAAYVGGFGGALLIMLFLGWLMYHYNKPADAGREAKAIARKKALTELQAADTDALKGYGWSIKDQKVTRLPVEQAMKMTVEASKNPAAARSNLVERADKAFPAPPPPPKSDFE